MSLFNKANLKIWLPMDEGTGRTLNNYSGVASATYISRSSTWRKNKDGTYSIKQNGTNESINLGTALSITTGYSVCMWIKMTDAVGGVNRSLFHNGVKIGCNPSSTYLNINSTTGEFQLGFGCGTSQIKSGLVPQIGNWYFVGFSIGAGQVQKLYVNTELFGPVTDVSQTLSSGNNMLGAVYWGGTLQRFNGQIRNFMLFERVLTDNEFKDLYRKTYIE